MMIWFECWNCDAAFTALEGTEWCPYCDSNDIEPLEEA